MEEQTELSTICQICGKQVPLIARCRSCGRWVCWNKQGEDCCSFQKGTDKSFWCINCISKQIVAVMEAEQS